MCRIFRGPEYYSATFRRCCAITSTAPATPGANQSFVSQPTLRPPTVSVTTSSQAAAAGDIFLTPDSGRGQNGAMIVDGRGRLVWFQPAAKGNQITDLQVQSYAGQPVLTFWRGHVDLGVGFGRDEIFGSSYRAAQLSTRATATRPTSTTSRPRPRARPPDRLLARLGRPLLGGGSGRALQDAIVQEVDIATGS